MLTRVAPATKRFGITPCQIVPPLGPDSSCTNDGGRIAARAAAADPCPPQQTAARPRIESSRVQRIFICLVRMHLVHHCVSSGCGQ